LHEDDVMANSSHSTDPVTESGYEPSGDTARETRPEELASQVAVAECARLRKELAEARDEVMRLRCQAEMLRQEWFTAKLQEEEYRKYIRKLTGSDPYVSPQEILEAEKSGLTMTQILEQMAKDPR
jgi:hypothetical protein